MKKTTVISPALTTKKPSAPKKLSTLKNSSTPLKMLAILIVSSGFALNIAAQEMRDPTRPANKEPVVLENADGTPVDGTDGLGIDGESQQASFPKVKLSAIVVTEDRKYAIIDNEVVYEGQQWKNVFLSNIKSYSVTFRLNDQTKEITINNNDFITESNDQY